LKLLWKFENNNKLEQFRSILDNHCISYEINSDKQTQKQKDSIALFVEENDYEMAKKLLLKHRKRRTSSDLA
jgi:hypothetical protein